MVIERWEDFVNDHSRWRHDLNRGLVREKKKRGLAAGLKRAQKTKKSRRHQARAISHTLVAIVALILVWACTVITDVAPSSAAEAQF